MTHAARVHAAVDNEDWQRFRVSLKGQATANKIALLECYMICNGHLGHGYGDIDTTQCDVCIRVDNYLKALCRGGQLRAQVDLQYAVYAHFNLDEAIKK